MYTDNIQWTRWLGIETSGLILEASYCIFSVTLVAGLRMSIFRRIRIILIFGARLVYDTLPQPLPAPANCTSQTA
jgi:hypothetical protein